MKVRLLVVKSIQAVKKNLGHLLFGSKRKKKNREGRPSGVQGQMNRGSKKRALCRKQP